MSRGLPPEPRSSEITPEGLYLRRREFIKNGAYALGTAAVTGGSLLWLTTKSPPPDQPPTPDLAQVPNTPQTSFDTAEPQTSFEDISSYNNFYEFGLDKDQPAQLARNFKTRPWTISVDGEVNNPQTIDIDDLLKWFPLEQRIYRMRCVEAWSMVIPWLGFPLGELIKRLEPNGSAKYVQFTTLLDPANMPGEKVPILDWPYVEGLRLDEAMNPLTMLAAGIYGKVLPNQNGAPLRLVVPWKYGFKGIKSIVKITFTRTQPRNTWQIAAPDEYGFFANVNPEVNHPRWSQAKEQRIGEVGKRPTLPFNGYGDLVASMYSGMDPKKLY